MSMWRLLLPYAASAGAKNHATFWLEGHGCHGGHLLLFACLSPLSIPEDSDIISPHFPQLRKGSLTEQACQSQAASLQV